MPITQNEEAMEVDNEEVKSVTIKSLETGLSEIFEQVDFIKFKEKLEIFNNLKLVYKENLLEKLFLGFESFNSNHFLDYFKDQDTLVKLDDKKVSSLIESIKLNRLEVLQGRFIYLKNELLETPKKKLLNLIQELRKGSSAKAQIDFNKALKDFLLKITPLKPNENNKQLFTKLDKQIKQLIELISQHKFIKVLDEIISELEFCKNLSGKSQALLSKQLEQHKFIEATYFANNNGDSNINLLLDLIDPNIQACVIDIKSALQISDILCSIFSEKDIKKTEACFPLLTNLLQTNLLDTGHLKSLLNGLIKTTDKCEKFISLIINQLHTEKQPVLDEALKTATEALKLNNIELLLNLGASLNQTEEIIKKFQEELEDKKNKDQHRKEKYEKLLTILKNKYNPPKLNNSETMELKDDVKVQLLITDIMAIMRADTKRAKQNHPISEELCQTIINKYKTTININIPEDYKANLLRLMQKRDKSFDNELEKFIQLNTSNKINVLNYLLSHAVCMTNIKAVQLLMLKGANPKIIDAQDNTLVHLAARNNQSKEIQASIIELIKILINEGVDKQAKNKEGHTLFSQAIHANQQYLIDFLSLNSRPDAAKSIRVNLSNGRQRLITDQKMLESELRKIEKDKHSELTNLDISELIKAWKVITNFDQLMSKIQIENDEGALNDYLKNFKKEYKETDLHCLKSLYLEAINLIKEKLRNLEMPMQESNEQNELASSLADLTVAAKQPKLEGVSSSSMLFARVPQSNESSLKRKEPNISAETEEVSLSFTP